MDFLAYSFVACLMVWTYFHFLRRGRASPKLAPGPYPLPIIGNLHQYLGLSPHGKLTKLSKIYGPLMSLHLGRIYTVIVSSPEMAKEILQKNDQAFSGRTIPASGEVHDHHKISIGYMPVGNQWRKLRKISKEQLFTAPRLEATQGLRQEKLQKLSDYLQKCCDAGRAVDIGEVAFITTFNLTSATVFSAEVTTFDDSSATTQEFRHAFESLTNLYGIPNVADFFPVLRPFDPQGIQRKSQVCMGKLLGFIGDIINQRLNQQSKGLKQSDVLETLLGLCGEGSEDEFISVEVIKHLLLDLFVAGSDTTPSTVEWAMTELLLNPDKLSKAKQEIRDVLRAQNKQSVEESDISRLPYLQAVIKEAFRLHPPGPFLIPRMSVSDVQVSGGYTVPKGTQMIVNAWAIGRDPSIWADPDSFEPERFLDSPIDTKGHHFELIPFGAGKRICPGLPLGNRMLHTIMATLIHNFDWKLEAGAGDKGERFGLALHKAVPLKAIPIKPLS